MECLNHDDLVQFEMNGRVAPMVDLKAGWKMSDSETNTAERDRILKYTSMKAAEHSLYRKALSISCGPRFTSTMY